MIAALPPLFDEVRVPDVRSLPLEPPTHTDRNGSGHILVATILPATCSLTQRRHPMKARQWDDLLEIAIRIAKLIRLLVSEIFDDDDDDEAAESEPVAP